MLKRNGILLIVLIAIFSLVCVACTQMPLKGSKNTITLPNDEVVWDLNGEWDAFIENYGEWKDFGTYSDVFKITQKGNSFVAIRKKGNPALKLKPGSEGVRGELYKSGFRKVQIISYFGPLDSDGQISKDGNKIIIDASEKCRQTLTRK